MNHDVTSPWYNDPTGFAAKITGAITGVLSLVFLVVGLFTGDEVNLEALAAALGTAVSGVVGVLALLKARTSAFAPATVAEVAEVSFQNGLAEADMRARP